MKKKSVGVALCVRAPLAGQGTAKTRHTYILIYVPTYIRTYVHYILGPRGRHRCCCARARSSSPPPPLHTQCTEVWCSTRRLRERERTRERGDIYTLSSRFRGGTLHASCCSACREAYIPLNSLFSLSLSLYLLSSHLFSSLGTFASRPASLPPCDDDARHISRPRY